MSDTKDTRTATQKIEDLEKVVTVLYQATAQLKNATESLLRTQGEMNIVKDALKIFNKKTEAIIQAATPETGITVKSVSDLVVKMNVEELTAQVAGFVASGHLVAAEEVAANSYLVCEELGADGTLVNPRIQFRIDSQSEETVAALAGKKAGDTVSFGENKFSAKILEVYSLVEPKTPEVEAPTPAEASAPEAPTAEVASAPTLDPLPPESPVTEFVPSDPSTMATA